MNKSLKWGGGDENKMEHQRRIFAFTHIFTTEDPENWIVSWKTMDDNNNTFETFNDERPFELDIVDI